MSEFVNVELGHCDVVRVEKSPLSKNKCDLALLQGKSWKLFSASRGKEMMIQFTSGEEKHLMKIGFARVGSVGCFPISKIRQEEFDKKAMLRFYTSDKVFFISDFTRYVRWRWVTAWDRYRSPDIVLEHNDWRANLYKNRHHKKFDVPVFEAMSEQAFFNGIGTFSKTEILCRTRFSPFTKLSEILESEILREDFFVTCKETLIDIYRLGGLQFKFWRNPFRVRKGSFNKWVRCYNKMGRAFFLRDSKGRKFWFDRQWIPDYAKWVKDYEVQDRRLIEKIYRYTENNS